MFCSKCGKTIPNGADSCPSCGKAVGNAHFTNSSYTSAQSIIVPGENEYEHYAPNNYTRTTYTTTPDAAEKGDIDSRTTYRPIYEDKAAAQVRDQIRSAAEESRERADRRDEVAYREVERRNKATQREIDRVKEEEEALDIDDFLKDEEPADIFEEEAAPEAEEIPDAPEIEEPVEDSEPVDPETLSEDAREKIRDVADSLRMDDDELDMSQFKARPIEARARAGISDDVFEYIRAIEDGQTRKARRKAAEPVEPLEDIDDLEDVIPETEQQPERRLALRRKPAAKPVEISDDIEEDIAEDLPETADDASAVQDIEPEENDAEESFDELYDEDGYDDDDYEDDSPSALGTIIKIVVAVLIVAALAFGIFRFVGFIRSKQSSAPIEGVSESVYTDAISMIESHATEPYRAQLINSYNTNGVLSVSSVLESDTAAINALLPEDPAPNDATFLQAVAKIQDNIGSAILMDAMNADSPTASADSAARWSVVDNSVAQLKGATSAAELTAIINGETITVHNETPAPTEAPIVYTPLQKGDENNDVLQLQVRLFTLGYLQGDRDGAYGSKTQTAIKLFQKTAGMPETGIADSETQARLYSDDAPYAPGATTPTPVPAETPEP